jgi:hypothetical protein
MGHTAGIHVRQELVGHITNLTIVFIDFKVVILKQISVHLERYLLEWVCSVLNL